MSQSNGSATAAEFPGLLEKIAARAASGSATSLAPSITERLKKKFGLGQYAIKRLKLYARLEQLYTKHPELVNQLISEAVAASVAARHPDRYFCVAIKQKLIDAGLAAEGPGEATW